METTQVQKVSPWTKNLPIPSGKRSHSRLENPPFSIGSIHLQLFPGLPGLPATAMFSLVGLPECKAIPGWLNFSSKIRISPLTYCSSTPPVRIMCILRLIWWEGLDGKHGQGQQASNKTPLLHSNIYLPSLKLTAKAPENWWLEDNPFLLGFGLFSRANCQLVLGRVDPPRSAKWMVRDAILQSLRLSTPPVEGCWYVYMPL